MQVEAQDALDQLNQEKRVARRIIADKYLYLAVDLTRQRVQLRTCRSLEALDSVVDPFRPEIPEGEQKAAILLFYCLLDEQRRKCRCSKKRLPVPKWDRCKLGVYFP